MNRRIVVTAMAVGMFVSVVPVSGAAMPGVFHRSGEQTGTKVRMIKFNVRNDSKAVMVLKVGEEQISVAPGETKSVRAQDGAGLTAVSGTSARPAGTLIMQVSRMLDGNTIGLS